MQCPNCGKTGFVSVGNKRYCSNCGETVGGPAPARAMSDIRMAKPQGSPGVVSSPAVPIITAPKPASQLHGRQVGGGAVLDLRSAPQPTAAPASPPPQAAPVTPAESSPISVATPPPAVPQPASQPAPTPPPASQPVPAPNPVNAAATPNITKDSISTRLEKAASIPKSNLIQKFPAKPTPVTPPVSEAAAVMPNAVATQIEAMGQQATTLEPRAEALQTALEAAKTSTINPKTVMAGLAAVAIMGTYIWTQNYPKMAFHSASTKAGVEATSPSYIPSSYRQAGPISYRAGEITISFNSPSISSPLNITQRKTDWDSNSLKENYVAKQTDNYTAVQGQGLTIYLFNKNQASWVNHGVWYTITGADNLNREQILKIAYGL